MPPASRPQDQIWTYRRPGCSQGPRRVLHPAALERLSWLKVILYHPIVVNAASQAIGLARRQAQMTLDVAKTDLRLQKLILNRKWPIKDVAPPAGEKITFRTRSECAGSTDHSFHSRRRHRAGHLGGERARVRCGSREGIWRQKENCRGSKFSPVKRRRTNSMNGCRTTR